MRSGDVRIANSPKVASPTNRSHYSYSIARPHRSFADYGVWPKQVGSAQRSQEGSLRSHQHQASKNLERSPAPSAWPCNPFEFVQSASVGFSDRPLESHLHKPSIRLGVEQLLCSRHRGVHRRSQCLGRSNGNAAHKRHPESLACEPCQARSPARHFQVRLSDPGLSPPWSGSKAHSLPHTPRRSLANWLGYACWLHRRRQSPTRKSSAQKAGPPHPLGHQTSLPTQSCLPAWPVPSCQKG